MISSSNLPSRVRRSRVVACLAVTALLLAGAVAVFAAAGSERSRAARGFSVKGSLRLPLHPGASRPLNLTLVNRHDFTLWVTRLRVRVSVDRRHRAAGCSARRNFAVAQLRSRDYPIRLRPRRRHTLRALRVRNLPRVRMRNLRKNQDACKGARLRLRYTGRARDTRPGPP